MKNKIYLVLFLATFQLGFPQLKKKYSIYLNFDSSIEQMVVSEKKMSDSIWVRTYSFSKDTSDEKCKSTLQINENGELIKQDKNKKPINSEQSIILYHYSYRNKVKLLDSMPESNVIYYDDFINSEFRSFNKVLKNAEMVYIIDKGDDEKNTSKIKAYQIVF